MARVVAAAPSYTCCICNKPLPPEVILQRVAKRKKQKSKTPFYCSARCYYHGRSIFLPEPETDDEAEEFETVLEERKTVMMSEEQKFILSQTPEDDSPEAEIRMREAICPNPSFSAEHEAGAYTYVERMTTRLTHMRKRLSA